MSDKKLYSETDVVSEENNSRSSSVFKKHRRLTYVVIISVVLICFVICCIVPAYSWFAPQQEADLSVTVSAFSATTEYRVTGSEYSLLSDDVQISVSSLNNLRLRLNYTGPSAAYVRVQLFESFKDSEGKLVPASDVVYNLSENWVEKDGYYYYKDILIQNSPYASPLNVNFVTGAALAQEQSVASGVNVNLVSVVEMAQPDRFDEFFGVSYDEVFGS